MAYWNCSIYRKWKTVNTANISVHRSTDTRHWRSAVSMKSKMSVTFTDVAVSMLWTNQDVSADSIHGSAKSYQRNTHTHWMSETLSFMRKLNTRSISLFFSILPKRYSFIDLAQIVCKLPETRIENSYVSSSDEDYDGYISEPSNLVSLTSLLLCSRIWLNSNMLIGNTISESEPENLRGTNRRLAFAVREWFWFGRIRNSAHTETAQDTKIDWHDAANWRLWKTITHKLTHTIRTYKMKAMLIVVLWKKISAIELAYWFICYNIITYYFSFSSFDE